jgi:uncharacterized membrane protein YphA (DoxX/SURF4 family)
MNALTTIARILVGIIFLFAGLIKANDPVGFANHLDLYQPALQMSWPHWISAFLSLSDCILEISLALLILLGTRTVFTLWAMLILSLGWGALNYYLDHLPKKVMYCECFSTLFPMTHGQAMILDIVILVASIILLIRKDYIAPLLSPGLEKAAVIVFIAGAFFLPLYTYNSLPLIDLLPYATGKNITEQNAKTAASYNGISNFFIQDLREKKMTDKFLHENDYSFWLIAWDIEQTNKDAQHKINDFALLCEKDHVTFIGLSASSEAKIKDFRHEVQAMYDFYKGDKQQLKNMIRANPGLLLMKNGTVIAKWHYRDIPPYHEVKKLYLKH